MTRTTLEALLLQQSQIAARIKTVKAKNINQRKKDDTRKKILAGAYVLDYHERMNTLPVLLDALDQFLFREADRALFGLAERVSLAPQNTTEDLAP